MYYFTDNIDKFKRGPIDNPSRNEPTFLTFSIDFPNMAIDSGIEDPETGLPTSPLFDLTTTNGAYQYLINRGYKYQANNLMLFIDHLNNITENNPWFFQSVSGLNALWTASTQMNLPMKGAEKKIDIETLESLDMSVTYLADLYRKTVYDHKYMREILPENLRWFDMDVYVAEFRNIQITKPVLEDTNNGLYQSTKEQKESVKQYTFFNDYKTYMKFSCKMCEFDFSESLPFEKLQVHSPEMSKNKMSVKPNWFVEKHEFNLQLTPIPSLTGGTKGVWTRPESKKNDIEQDHSLRGVAKDAIRNAWRKPPPGALSDIRNSVNRYKNINRSAENRARNI